MNAKAIENSYRNYLLTMDGVDDAFVEKTMEYVSCVALRSRRNRGLVEMMSRTGYMSDMCTDDITMHIMKKSNELLKCPADKRIPMLVTMVNFKLIDIVRKWSRENPTVKSGGRAENDETHIDSALFSLMDDVSWGMLASDTDIEAEYIEREDERERAELLVSALESIRLCTRFEALSLLATKVVSINGERIKTGVLAKEIESTGMRKVSERVFKAAAEVFSVPCETYFAGFADEREPEYASTKELCSKISHASNACAVKLSRKMGVERRTYGK